MGAWEHGRMGAWEHGSMGAWEHGSMGAWEHGSMGACMGACMGSRTHTLPVQQASLHHGILLMAHQIRVSASRADQEMS